MVKTTHFAPKRNVKKKRWKHIFLNMLFLKEMCAIYNRKLLFVSINASSPSQLVVFVFDLNRAVRRDMPCIYQSILARFSHVVALAGHWVQPYRAQGHMWWHSPGTGSIPIGLSVLVLLAWRGHDKQTCQRTHIYTCTHYIQIHQIQTKNVYSAHTISYAPSADGRVGPLVCRTARIVVSPCFTQCLSCLLPPTLHL